MKIFVHVRDKVILVQCGPGTQSIRWLGVARFDSSSGIDLGVPRGLKRDSGEVLDLNGIIKDILQEDEHVWVILSEDEDK
ncbi:uncharacterized protein MONOS_4373 [Monocercomonoides exilis]|uniref:uncharacterized protein n=1 Tax=Monocercomonoides exilis TaxID=2049356 RepID=UPI003559F049|nr:hypothetical protein MONOS_4373 [Monocercomonoides exilis]|eukprot:MONOS_4373.1-p1 / transcript=MONOS_4373.1 / gene=MONOS_4373 / organism=Monocercomonoides_exilis_PA203 / gene_product=unspecified product / transcript_product=unspecified product / location=Mono_scaffold00115:89807-90345(+) / protein_length=80 / sequence_SO=supercontig / SO=protein_coding / is_pseudo=false